ncbi:MAG: hypothetical protein KJ072_01925 [Verrucomicrobia bacterium]|nr:hypothetical protein [Verrucomicrobiota bacterium]
MIHRFQWFVAGLLFPFLIGMAAAAGEFRLANGNTLQGELTSADEEGIVVQLDVGGFTRREPWINISQPTLRELAQDSELRDFVEPFIEPTPEELNARREKKEILVRPVPTHFERPAELPGFFPGLISPIGLLLLVIVAGANLYAAYEVALYRQQSTPVVCIVSFFLPVLGPIIFLSLPTQQSSAEPAYEVPAEVAGAAGRKTTGMVAAKPSGLSLASMEKAGPGAAHSQPQIYNRGEHTFNRRFFESKFPGFFRVVVGEAEKDLVLVFKCVKNEYVGRRISRISSNELHLQLLNSTTEVSISFADITTVILRHKDAKA